MVNKGQVLWVTGNILVPHLIAAPMLEEQVQEAKTYPNR